VTACAATSCGSPSSAGFLEDTCGIGPILDDFRREAGAAPTGAWQESSGADSDGVALTLAPREGRAAPSLVVEATAPRASGPRRKTWSRDLAGAAAGCAQVQLAVRVDTLEGGGGTFAALRFDGGVAYAIRVTADLALELVEADAANATVTASGAGVHVLARAPLARGTWTAIDLLAWSGEPGKTPPVLRVGGADVPTELPARARGAARGLVLGLLDADASGRVDLAIDDVDVR
jgi:hypothetical protein